MEFCEQQQVSPSLSEIRGEEAKLGYLLVYAIRYRRQGRTGHPVSAGTVETNLLAVGEGIANLGAPDPRKDRRTGKLHPLYSAFLKALKDDDDPPSRAYPVNISIIRTLFSTLDFDHLQDGALNEHICDLIVVAFFWLLRPAEYTLTPDEDSRSQAFTLGQVHLTISGRVYHALEAPLNDPNCIGRIEYATLEFGDQKNAVRGEQVGHRATADPLVCPAKALGRIVQRLRHHHAPAHTPLHHHYNHRHPTRPGWYPIKSKFVTNALRHAASLLEASTGISHHLISARSLRPGGATALLCANVSSDAIMLLGRWKSDAMFRYLRIQAATQNFAQDMLDHGAFTFAPSVFAQRGLPQQTPAPVVALAARDEMTR